MVPTTAGEGLKEKKRLFRIHMHKIVRNDKKNYLTGKARLKLEVCVLRKSGKPDGNKLKVYKKFK